MASDVRIQNLLSGIADAYPHLRAEDEAPEGALTIAGVFPVRHEGRDVDRFYIRMGVPLDFPRQWPAVWETAGRIPHTMDRHVVPSDGSLCAMLPDEAYLKLPPDITLLDYLDGPLRHFFIGQLCVEQGQPWPWGEHDHGIPAVIKFYGDFLKIDDERGIVAVLYRIWEGRYKGHWLCSCGSGLIIRKCHGGRMQKITGMVPKERLAYFLGQYASGKMKEEDVANTT